MQVYLDNSATTKVCKEAADKAYEIMTQGYGNPSSLHSLGNKAAKELKNARKQFWTDLTAEISLNSYLHQAGLKATIWR